MYCSHPQQNQNRKPTISAAITGKTSRRNCDMLKYSLALTARSADKIKIDGGEGARRCMSLVCVRSCFDSCSSGHFLDCGVGVMNTVILRLIDMPCK